MGDVVFAGGNFAAYPCGPFVHGRPRKGEEGKFVKMNVEAYVGGYSLSYPRFLIPVCRQNHAFPFNGS